MHYRERNSIHGRREKKTEIDILKRKIRGSKRSRMVIFKVAFQHAQRTVQIYSISYKYIKIIILKF